MQAIEKKAQVKVRRGAPSYEGGRAPRPGSGIVGGLQAKITITVSGHHSMEVNDHMRVVSSTEKLLRVDVRRCAIVGRETGFCLGNQEVDVPIG